MYVNRSTPASIDAVGTGLYTVDEVERYHNSPPTQESSRTALPRKMRKSYTREFKLQAIAYFRSEGDWILEQHENASSTYGLDCNLRSDGHTGVGTVEFELHDDELIDEDLMSTYLKKIKGMGIMF
ncbi:hypothetical protein EV426DRAFT_701277 [Tirmania nivea]|nr:hypothetical protein EV426DRAFT_701277 [Tirmania nivea]